MTTKFASDAIFVHSLWRSGSTYVFRAFRRSPAGYWTYQEPVHEAVYYARTDPSSLLVYNEETSRLRHPLLDKPYYHELVNINKSWCNSIKETIIYDDYFGLNSNEPLIHYLAVLISSAKSRPVIQECRTSNRIGILKKALGGTHIYLWRNPYDQWWSLKIADYFNAVLQLIINADNKPRIISLLRDTIDFKGVAGGDIRTNIDYFENHPLTPEDSYLVFYIIWFLGLSEGLLCADMLINIDLLTDSEEYRRDTINHINSIGIYDIDFSDCTIPQGTYFQSDRELYNSVEELAHDLLISSGYSEHFIKKIKNLRDECAPTFASCAVNGSVIRDLKRSREIIHRLESMVAYKTKSHS